MMWLTWRQFRAQAITAVAALAAFAIVLALTESHMASMYDSSGLTSCHGGTCAGLATTFLVQLSSGQGVSFLPVGANVYVLLYFLSVLVVLVAPAIIGIFWGAPMISRELEAGTFRLTWNQSVTRTRWLTVKLALIGVTAMVVTEAFSLLQAWWAAPIGKAVGLGGGASILSEGRFGWFVFPSHGITPLGYAAFAFALGVTAGLLIRRPIPAMAVTLVIFAAFQAVVPLWIRPNLFPTSQTTATIAASGANVSLRANPGLTLAASIVPGQPGAWIISSEGVNAAGQQVGTIPAACEPAVTAAFQNSNLGPSAVNTCVARQGIRVAESYQPASHYWPLQFAETGFFLVVALALAWYCCWRLNRRLS
jgi:ABC-type transport system involved in multi-copper enzyme maturation permease subunit